MSIDTTFPHTLAQDIQDALSHKQSLIVIDIWKAQEKNLQEYPVWLPKFHYWLAQAHALEHAPKLALRHCNTGIRLAKMISDTEMLMLLEQLREGTAQQLLQEQAPPTPLEDALELIAHKQYDQAKDTLYHLYHTARTQQDHKMEILALLALAKIPSLQQECVTKAYDRCQELDDFNLITLVKKSMDALGIPVPVHIF